MTTATKTTTKATKPASDKSKATKPASDANVKNEPVDEQTTATKAEPKPKKKKEKTPVTDEQLKQMEDALRVKYDDQDIVEGSIAAIHAPKALNGNDVPAKFQGWNKYTVEIRCQWVDENGDRCPETRRVATSDLAQVRYCEQHTLEFRKQRRKELRALKSDKPAAK